MKDFTYPPPVWWFMYGVGAYMAYLEHFALQSSTVPEGTNDGN